MHAKKWIIAPSGGVNRFFILQFQVGTVILYGVPIVSLIIESQERLCLAQISNTLLKQFSYNEIHNRRVALGKVPPRLVIKFHNYKLFLYKE